MTTKVKYIADNVVTVDQIDLTTLSTTNVSEGTNLYYTDARVGSYLTSNSYATESYVTTAVSNLVDAAPATLDTLNELAAALGDDANFSTTVTTSLAGKVSKSGDSMTGNLTVSGSVGIGTTSPSQPLETVSSTFAYNRTRSTNGAYTGFDVGQHQSGQAILNLRDSNFMAFLTADTERMRITSAGNVGINSSATNAKLEVVATSGEVFRADASGGAYRIVANQTGVNMNGNVGIGTSSPAVALDVSGGNSLASRAAFTRTDTSSTLEAGAWFTAGPYVGSATNHPLQIITNDTERMRINSSGNVGIGTTSGTQRLEVSGGAAQFNGGGIDGSLGTAILFGNTTYASHQKHRIRSAVSSAATLSLLAFESGTATIGSFNDNQLVLRGNGNVGIGTSSPSNARTVIVTDGTNGANEVALALNHGDPGLAINQEVRLNFGQGSDANIALSQIASSYTGGTFNGSLIFRVNNGAAGNLTERMRIDGSGNVLIGKSSSADSAFVFETTTANNKGSQINTVVLGRSSSGYPIVGYNCAPTGTTNTYKKYLGDFASWIHFSSGRIDTFTTTTTANETTTGTAGPYLSRGGTSWTSSSDRRLKDNIESITYGLEAVKSLNPVSYVRNDRDTGVKELGFIAQEVDEVVSEVVSVREDGFYGIDYERLIPVLTKAIQEQQEIINDLRARVAQLEEA